MTVKWLIIVLICLISPSCTIQPETADWLADSACRNGCKVLAVACYALVGFTFGITGTLQTGVAALVACNAGLGICVVTRTAVGCR